MADKNRLTNENLNFYLQKLLDENFQAFHIEETMSGGKFKDTREKFITRYHTLFELLQKYSDKDLQIIDVLKLYLKIRVEGFFSIRDDEDFKEKITKDISVAQKKIEEYKTLLEHDTEEFKLSRIRLQLESTCADVFNNQKRTMINLSNINDEYFEDYFKNHLFNYFKNKHQELLNHYDFLKYSRDSFSRRNVIIELLSKCLINKPNPSTVDGSKFLAEVIMTLEKENFYTPDIHNIELSETIRKLFRSGLK